jgi:1-hydroxycarotenoid 3,4-desaturase
VDTQQEPYSVQNKPIVIVGAGIGGLSAACLLAARGEDVVIIERQAAPGGKMRHIPIDGALIDGGPTVFTMRYIFDAIFAEAGTSLEAELGLKPLSVLARHSWGHGAELDLFADLKQSADAIAQFAGPSEGKNFLSFQAESRRVFNALKKPFIESQRPNPLSLATSSGLGGMLELMRINPFETLWSAVSRHFKDPRLRQLYGRYATYCGSSPFEAVATLMLIAHVEQDGVWSVDGGMHAVARAFERVFLKLGGTIRYGVSASEIEIKQGRVSALITSDGERTECSDMIINADVNAVASGLFGSSVQHAVNAVPVKARSLSAITWATHLKTHGFPLEHHNVFFSHDYKKEFGELASGYPSDPTVYICAQDRPDHTGGNERLLILVNSPANGDHSPQSHEKIELAMRLKLAQCGLSIEWHDTRVVTTPPSGFAGLFPATGGAIYGRASHGWLASFQRAAAKTKILGLYLAGGSAHPGPGVPMAAMSGRLAADALMAQRASTRKFHRGATIGGTSTR